MSIERIEAPDLEIDRILAHYNKQDPGVVSLDQRQRNERSILASLIKHLGDNGWALLRVWDTEEFTSVTEAKECLELAFNLDEVYVYFRKDKAIRVVYFIWGNGNDGKDCVTDYSYSDRDDFGALVDAFCEKLEELW